MPTNFMVRGEMTKIRINTDEIRKTAKKLDGLSVELLSLGRESVRVASNAPPYEGQFRSRISLIGHDVSSRISSAGGELTKFGNELTKIVARFENADEGFGGKRSILDWLNLPQWLKLLLGIGDKSVRSMIQNILVLGYLGLRVNSCITQGTIPGKFNFKFGKSKKLTEQEALDKLSKELADFRNTETGRELIEGATAAGILIVLLDSKGNIIESIGDPNSTTQIPVSWVSPSEDKRMKGCNGFYDPESDGVFLNADKRNNDHIYEHTLYHEIKHAVYNHTGDPPEHFTGINQILSNERTTQQPLSDSEIKTIEKEVEEWLSRRVNDEIEAHDIGYEHQGGTNEEKYGVMLDRTDGVDTKGEREFILEKRGYGSDYEEYFEEIINSRFPNGPKYSLNLHVDANGQIQVELKKKKKILGLVWA